MITRINHIGIAVNSIDEILQFYTAALGLKLKDIEVVQEQKVRTAIIPVGESKIELLEATSPDSPIAKHIEKRGEGLHHLAFEVDDIKATLEMLAQKGVALVDSKPRTGVEKTQIAFLHPKSGKALLEIVET